MFKKLAKQLKTKHSENSYFPMSSPFCSLKNQTKKTFLNSLSKHALSLYERKTDINNFTKLVLSDPENTSHNEIVDEIFQKNNLSDAFDDSALFSLSENKNFLKDLGL